MYVCLSTTVSHELSSVLTFQKMIEIVLRCANRSFHLELKHVSLNLLSRSIYVLRVNVRISVLFYSFLKNCRLSVTQT